MQRPVLLLGLFPLAATTHGQQSAAPPGSQPPVDGPGRFQAVYPVQYDPMSVEQIAAEMISLRKGKGAQANINDGSMQFAPLPSRF